MNQEVELKRATREDCDRVAGFLGSIFPDNPKSDPDVMRWQYWDNPYGDVGSWFFEDADGNVLAHCMAFPVPVYRHGTVGMAAKGGDGATSPQARGQGLFGSVANAAYRDAGRRGMAFTFATPNASSVRGVAKSGFDLIGRVPVWALPLDAGWMSERLHLPRALLAPALKLAIRKAVGGRGSARDKPPGDIDSLWDATLQAEPTPSRLVHDQDWWDWRYSRPGAAYRLHSVTEGGVLRGLCASLDRDAFGARVLHVMEVLALDEDAAAAVLAAAIADRDTDVVAVAAVATAGTRQARLLQTVGMRKVPVRLQPSAAYVGLVHNTDGLPDLSAEPWSVTWADFDHL